ncbi:hypothetical protein ACGC1H_003034 [Rhizoctonia solani]
MDAFADLILTDDEPPKMTSREARIARAFDESKKSYSSEIVLTPPGWFQLETLQPGDLTKLDARHLGERNDRPMQRVLTSQSGPFSDCTSSVHTNKLKRSHLKSFSPRGFNSTLRSLAIVIEIRIPPPARCLQTKHATARCSILPFAARSNSATHQRQTNSPKHPDHAGQITQV